MKPKLLLIEDDAAIIDILRINFERAGFEVHGCSRSRESLKECLAQLPDAIILDLLMPERSGWKVLEDLKAHPVVKDIPVIICSVGRKKELHDIAREMGAAAFISKPFDVAEMLKLVQGIVGQEG